jgi:hypothetical protein
MNDTTQIQPQVNSVVEPKIEPHYGRRALVGQYTEDRNGTTYCLANVINASAGKKYPVSSKRQAERAKKRSERQRAEYDAKMEAASLVK